MPALPALHAAAFFTTATFITKWDYRRMDASAEALLACWPACRPAGADLKLTQGQVEVTVIRIQPDSINRSSNTSFQISDQELSMSSSSAIIWGVLTRG
jgi:hypothetical protein